jgi:hypothetical protein
MHGCVLPPERVALAVWEHEEEFCDAEVRVIPDCAYFSVEELKASLGTVVAKAVKQRNKSSSPSIIGGECGSSRSGDAATAAAPFVGHRRMLCAMVRTFVAVRSRRTTPHTVQWRPHWFRITRDMQHSVVNEGNG